MIIKKNQVVVFENFYKSLVSCSIKLSLFKNYDGNSKKNILDLNINNSAKKETFFLNAKVYNYKLIKKLLSFKESSFGSRISILNFCELVVQTIPHYCYHFNLSIAGNCRMCLVELSPNLKPIAACAIPIELNIKIRTNTFLVKRAREGIMEFLLVNHPLDCPICDQGGECDLQDQGLVYGNSRGRYYHQSDFKRSISELMCNSFVKLILTRCIHCTRCIRFLNEIAGDYSLGMLGRGNLSEIGLYNNNELITELGSNITDFCPVGALTIKQYSLETRSWEESYLDTIDLNDSFCTPIRAFIVESKVTRVLPKYNEELRVSWISDISRFCLDGLDLQRQLSPQLNLQKFTLVGYKNNFFNIIYLKQNNFIPMSWPSISNELKNICFSHINLVDKNLVNTFLGNMLDLDLSLGVRDRLASEGNNNFKVLCESNSNNLSQNLNLDFEKNYIFRTNNFGYYSNIILSNINLRFENPVLNAKLRQKVIWDKKSKVFFIGAKYNLTYKYYQLGLTTKALAKILEGRNYLVNLFNKGNKNLLLYNNDLFIPNTFNFVTKFGKNIDINYLVKGSSGILNLDLGLNRTIIKNSEFFIKSKYQSLVLNFYLRCNKLLPISTLEQSVDLHKLNIFFDSYGDHYFNFVKFFFPLLNLIEQSRIAYYTNCYGVIKVQKKKIKINLKKENKYRVFNLNDFKDDFEVINIVFNICLGKNLITKFAVNYERINDFFPFFELFKRRIIFLTVLKQKNYNTLFYYFLLSSKYKNPFNKTLLLSNSINLSTISRTFFKKKTNFTS